jgi:hypothetical protein
VELSEYGLVQGSIEAVVDAELWQRFHIGRFGRHAVFRFTFGKIAGWILLQ